MRPFQIEAIVFPWRFLEYQSQAKKLPVSDWWTKLSLQNRVLAALFVRKMWLSLEDSGQLDRDDFKRIRRKNLWEARWKGEQGVQHRLLCDPLGDKTMTFLCGCTHKGRRYTPTNALKTAENRSRDLQQKGKASTHEFILWSLETTP